MGAALFFVLVVILEFDVEERIFVKFVEMEFYKVCLLVMLLDFLCLKVKESEKYFS